MVIVMDPMGSKFWKSKGLKHSKNNKKKRGKQDRKYWYKMLENGQMTDFAERFDPH